MTRLALLVMIVLLSTGALVGLTRMPDEPVNPAAVPEDDFAKPAAWKAHEEYMKNNAEQYHEENGYARYGEDPSPPRMVKRHGGLNNWVGTQLKRLTN